MSAIETEEFGAMTDLLDLRGLKCPLPALKADKRLRSLRPGTRLTILADDPLAAIDIPHLLAGKGHRLIALDQERADGSSLFLAERGPDPEPADRL